MYGLNEEQTAKQQLRMADAKKAIIEQQLDPKSREAFLLRRSCGLGGSDMAALMGLNPWKSPYQLWLEKVGLVAPSTPNLATEFGVWNEEFVAQHYAKTTRQTIGTFHPYFLPQIPYFISNYDRVVFSDETRRDIAGGLEIKTCSINAEIIRPEESEISKKWGRGNSYNAAGEIISTDDRIDPLYYPQVQFYLYTSGLPWWDVSVLIGGREIRTFRVLPDPVFQARMIQAAVVFWQQVLDNTPPALTFKDAAQVEELTPAVEASDETVALCAQYKELQAQSKAIEAQLQVLKDKIAMAIGTSEKMTYQKGGKTKTLCSFKPMKRTTLDTKLLAQEKPEIYEQYTRETQTARILRVY